MIKDDGTVIHFNNPKVQASLSANTFAITGHGETKQLTEMLPGILSQLGADSLSSLRKLAEQFPRQCEHAHTKTHVPCHNVRVPSEVVMRIMVTVTSDRGFFFFCHTRIIVVRGETIVQVSLLANAELK